MSSKFIDVHEIDNDNESILSDLVNFNAMMLRDSWC